MAAGRNALGRMLTAVASASLGAAVRAAVRGLTRPAPSSPSHQPRTPAPASARQQRVDTAGMPANGRSAGPAISYAPHPDEQADPGEVVWTWVPYEEDATKGKDRPVLVIARDGDALLALPLTSKDHDRDAVDEARWGRHWMDVGSGGWDARGRPSEVRLDRVIRVDPDDVRREGAGLPRDVFDRVVAAAREINGWS